MWADNETKQDLLGYQVHADLLSNILLKDEMLPITIGVFGNWGSGKSSLMLLMEQKLAVWQKEYKTEGGAKGKSGVLQIRFNSWQFDNYESNKMSLIDTMLTSIREDINKRTDIFTQADTLLSNIKFLEVGSFVLRKIYENLTPEEIKKWLPDQKDIDKMTGDKEYRELHQNVTNGNSLRYISQFRKLFEELIIEADYKAVVVYIDDLDRCKPERIIDCLEAVKLFVNVQRTAFVIGADERIIEYAISQQYPIEPEKDDISSPFSDYLEKLIQLPYKIPKLSLNEQKTYLYLLLCKKYATDAHFQNIHSKYIAYRQTEKYAPYTLELIKQELPMIDLHGIEKMEPVIPLITQFLNGNPRQLKRFLNTLDVRMKLAEVAGFQEIKPDVLTKLMILEYHSMHRNRFEDLFKRQNVEGGFIKIAEIENQAKEKQKIENADWEKDWNSPYLVKWLAASPSLDAVNLQNYFWVARDALKNETPVDSLVTSRMQRIYKDMMQTQTLGAAEKRLQDYLQEFSSEDYEMLVMLMNSTLRSNARDASVWRLLTADKEDKIIDGQQERLKALLGGVVVEQIDPQAHVFFERMVQHEELKTYVNGLTFHKSLISAMKYQNKK